jgi:hypothetical protein
MSLTIRKLWRKCGEDAKFFCISTKVPNTENTWKDHFFRPDQFEDIPEFLQEHHHLELYFCPHGFNRRSRTLEEVVAPKLLWADLDEVNPELIPDRLKPTVAIQSSEGRFVGLWVLTDKAVTEDLNKRLNKHICPESHSSWIFTKALRMPGTNNRKYRPPQKVMLLWDDGPKYTYGQLDKLLPNVGEPKQSGSTAREIFNKYRKHIDVSLQREIFRGQPKKGVRSEMIWKIIMAFLEAGATEDEIYEVVHVSPWNKFAGLRTEERSIRKQIAKAFGDKLTGHGNKVKPKHKKTELEADLDDGKYNEAEETRELQVLQMSEVEEEDVDWLWPGRLPKNELVILEGDPGVGKSFLAQYIGCRVADGKKLPMEYPTGDKPEKGRVLYFDLENDAARVTKKRLVANGLKNLKDFYQVAAPLSIDDPDDMELVFEVMNKIKPVLVVFDTINNYIGGADIHNSKEATQALTPFSQLARNFNCTVIVLRHLTKNSKGTSALYRGQGSIAQTGVARVVLSVGRVENYVDDDEDTTKYVGMAVTKNNLAHMGKTLVYHIDYDVKAKGGYDDKAKIDIDGYIDLDADELLGPREEKKKGKESKDGGEKNALANAEAFLLDQLNQGQKVKFSKLLDEAEVSSVTHRELRMAAKKLKVVKEKGFWSLATK